LKKLLALFAFSVLLLVPLGVQYAFAGLTPVFEEGPYPGVVPGFEDNYVHACWTWDIPNDLVGPLSLNHPNCGASAASNPQLGLSFSTVDPSGTCFDGTCNFDLPNWIDELPFKDIKVTVSYSNPPGTANTPPNMPTVTCHDQTLPGGQASGTYQATIPAQNTIMWFLICDPNPDWEEIDFTYDPALTSILQVDIWTTSFDHTVGGEFIGVDSTALLVTGAQMNAAWMIPVIVSAIGIGIVIARKF